MLYIILFNALKYFSAQLFRREDIFSKHMLKNKLTNHYSRLMNNTNKNFIVAFFIPLFNLSYFSPVQAQNSDATVSNIKHNQDLILKNTDCLYSMIIFLFLTITTVTILIFLNKKLIKLKKELTNKNLIISDQKMLSDNFNATLSKALQERELLLKEIHHRVKNNLQTIMSLLRVEAKEGTKINDINYFVEKSQTRILSISLIHQNLYENENLKNIDYKSYLNDMCKNLDSILNVTNKEIQFIIHTDTIFLDLQTASTLGLILNELISNSYKHAFTNEIEGTIKISIVRNFDSKYTVTYSDNGVGMSADKTATHKSLGLELIELWTKQLHGKLTSKTKENGLEYEIVFNETT